MAMPSGGTCSATDTASCSPTGTRSALAPGRVDLVPDAPGNPVRAPERQRDAFIAAYGHDIRTWDGYPVLREIRELSTITALLREGNANKVAQRELQIRLRSLHTGNDQQWTTF